ncbi:hypothetical protein PG985_011126 [Apiospora marii]|uniref:Uncharacterized protein n=1 Tax=Apiospora marii TaxID=335849 RepID=A0ABR1SV48_9PEZI
MIAVTGEASYIEGIVTNKISELNPVMFMLDNIRQIESDVVDTLSGTELESKQARMHTVHELMDELDRTISGKLGPTWPNLLRLNCPKDPSQPPVPLLELAIASRISSYVIKKLEENPEIPETIFERPWLDWVLRPNPEYQSTKSKVRLRERLPKRMQSQSNYAEPYILKPPSPDTTPMVPNKPLALYLLDHGANPNQKLALMPGAAPSTTVWAAFLADYYRYACDEAQSYPPATQNDLYQVIIAMIDKGADTAITVPNFYTSGPNFYTSHDQEVKTKNISVARVARRLLSNKRQVETIEAALKRRETEKQTYLAPIISWFRLGKQWV